jgi:hypothetical protein
VKPPSLERLLGTLPENPVDADLEHVERVYRELLRRASVTAHREAALAERMLARHGVKLP